MEGIREIARAYYERASLDKKKCINEFFTKIDTNRDGKIRFFQDKKCVSSSFSSEDIFRKLDKNGDGALDFDDVLCLYYMVKKTSIARCNACSDLLLGPYFSCSLCFEKRATYDLCCCCYRNPNLLHEHSCDYMLDHHSLIRAFKDRTLGAHKTRREKEMEELHEIAKAHYWAGSPEVQALAYQFYESMDIDGDGRVNIHEFLTFMRDEGCNYMFGPDFFQELDLNGNGTLEFFEVMTLYYIIKSGRPFCDGCLKFIPGIYFSCIECFNPESSYDLCRDCYQSTNYSHNHNGRVQFLDNYTLLRTRRDLPLAQSPNVDSNLAWTTSSSNHVIHLPAPNHSHVIIPATNMAWTTSSNANICQTPIHSNAIVPATNMAWTTSSNANISQTPNHSNAIVPATNMDKWKFAHVALKAFEIGLSIGSISGTLCTIL